MGAASQNGLPTISPGSIRHWSKEFPNVEIELVEMRAADHGLNRIGHSGFFRPKRAILWEELLLPRLARTPAK
jgi:predicted alpha/beta hydrolase